MLPDRRELRADRRPRAAASLHDLPTSFVLPTADVDGLREVAGELLRENAVYRKLVQDLGGSLPR